MFSLPGGVRFSPNFLCPGSQGFELEKFSAVLKEKCRNSRFVLKKLDLRQLEKQVFLCCFISIFAKVVDVYCIFDNIDHFWSLSGHPRVTLLMYM